MRLDPRILPAMLALVLAVGAAGQARAGAVPLPSEQELAAAERAEEQRRQERIARFSAAAQLYHRVAREFAPGMTEPLIDYATVDMAGPACTTSDTPRTHAILIGVNDIGIARSIIEGPENDLELLVALLLDRGVKADNIHSLTGDRATREGVAATFRDLLTAVGCEDRVLVHFSGWGAQVRNFSMGATKVGDDHPLKAEWDALGGQDMVSELQQAFAAGEIDVGPEMRFFVEAAFDAADPDLAILLHDSSETFHELMLGRDLSDYVVALRNRGAHVVVMLDTDHAAAANLRQRQQEAGEESAWTQVYDPAGAAAGSRSGNLLVPGHGDFAVFYAAGPDHSTGEMMLPRGAPDARRLGLFTFTVASALAMHDLATPRSVAAHVQEAYQAQGRKRPHPVFQASQPDLLLFAEAARAQSGESPIRILSPTPKRGATAVERPEIEIAGVVEWPSRVLGVHVGAQPAKLDANGRFSATVPLASGMNTVNVVAVTADSRMHRQTLEFVYEGDKKALEGEGRRYAVIIANQTYGGTTGFSPLATPFADADALGALLTSKYGFETNIRQGNTDVSLVLKDPTKVDIQRALHHVGRAAGEKDTVLVYYAGHGIFEPVTSTAYWVPADAEAGFEPSYLSAADISAAIQRIQAGSVVLISDSCYSGALIRGGGGEKEAVEDGERLQALLRMQARRSRVVITSGNNEPVEDLGGRGHSVFARALLTGLERMEHEAFSARELFDGYILNAVTANADQEPQYRPLEKVGHEGGDFVFVRMPAASATAQ